jgi:hypothetical protein
MNVKLYAEIESNCTLKQVEQIARWLSRMKAVRKDAAFALVCPALSPRCQSVCIEKGIDFIDLAGNVLINIPGNPENRAKSARKDQRTILPKSTPYRLVSGDISRGRRRWLSRDTRWLDRR